MLENLDRLKAFYHVFSWGSVGGAAQSLHVTQPAVSQAIQKLEGEMKTQLFIRRNKQIFPTSAGEQLFAVVQPFMMELEVCLKNFDHARDYPFGELRVGAPAEFGKACLPGIMAAFRKKYPDVTFYLTFGSPEKLCGLVAEGKIDLALIDLFLAGNRFVTDQHLFSFEPIAEERIILACSQRYFTERMKDDLSPDVLLTQDFIEYAPDGHILDYWFRHHYAMSKRALRTVMIVDSHEAVISAIRHHMGLGIVATHLVDKEIRRGELIPIVTPKKGIVNQISLISLQHKVLTLSENVFKHFLQARIRGLGL